MLCILETTVEIMSCDTVFKCFNTLFSIVYVDLWGDVQIFSYEIINYTPTEASIYNHRAFSKKKQQNQFDLKKKQPRTADCFAPLENFYCYKGDRTPTLPTRPRAKIAIEPSFPLFHLLSLPLSLSVSVSRSSCFFDRRGRWTLNTCKAASRKEPHNELKL